jgi:hypothetical protein
MPVSDWSEAWLSYTAFDGIAVSGNDLRTMPPAVQAALFRYAECGGMLLVLGDTTVPESWRGRTGRTIDGRVTLEVGFGRCFLVKSELPEELREPVVKQFKDALAASARDWQALPDQAAANSAFPVVENVRVPTRGIAVIMLAFVVVIGPVNIIVLSRKNRRTWLLWTIPAISIFTTFLVFVYSFLREGVTPDVRIEGVTYLDQQNHRASTFGMTAFYCPLTPGEGLFFSSETEATPLVTTWDQRGAAREVDWTQGQHLGRGRVSARVPAHIQIRKSETRRERIQLESDGNEQSVVNGLGAPIQSLWVCDSAGRIYTASDIAPGSKTQLKPFSSSSASPAVLETSKRLDLKRLWDLNSANAVSHLSPNSYIAELKGNPFLENGLGAKAKSARTKAKSVVYGLLETNPQL